MHIFIFIHLSNSGKFIMTLGAHIRLAHKLDIHVRMHVPMQMWETKFRESKIWSCANTSVAISINFLELNFTVVVFVACTMYTMCVLHTSSSLSLSLSLHPVLSFYLELLAAQCEFRYPDFLDKFHHSPCAPLSLPTFYCAKFFCDIVLFCSWFCSSLVKIVNSISVLFNGLFRS